MTFREKFKLDHSRDVNVITDCPSHHDYEPIGSCEVCVASEDVCSRCWDREMPEVRDKDIEAIEQFANTSNNCAQSPEDIRKALEIAEKMSATPHILDSGARREFETGAVRDIQEGKGRCDLLPLDVIGGLYDVTDIHNSSEVGWVFRHIRSFTETDDVTNLYIALRRANIFENTETMLLEVAKHFEEGCKKYGDNNWQKGIPTHCYIDSAVRHYLKYLRGDKDEPHDRAFCWNILCCIWTCIHKPEMDDFRKAEEF